MIAEDGRRTVHEQDSVATAERAVLEQRTRLRKLLRGGMAKVEMAVMGAQQSIRATVATVRHVFSTHLAQADAPRRSAREGEPSFDARPSGRLRRELVEALAELETLSAWPEEEDELELAIRFQTVASVLLDAMTREEHDLLETGQHDLAVDDPFGC
jgi:hypothetical protein